VEKGGKSAESFAKTLPMSKGVGKVFTHKPNNKNKKRIENENNNSI
jgi:hypothetical protein